MSEYKNFALMLQHSVQAIQYAHFFSMQAFKMRKELADKIREVAGLQKTIKKAEVKMKTLSDQAEAAIKAKDEAEEKTDAVEAIKKVLEAQKKEVEEKMAAAQKELQDALVTKEAKIQAIDEKAYVEGAADVKEDYKKQVKQACNKGFTIGWMTALKKLDVPEDSPLKNADDKKGEVSKDASSQKTNSEVLIVEKSLDQTLQEIDAELAAEKAAENSSQLSFGGETQPAADAE
ncbi:uncharacterized protein LOC114320075 [Camellia sinensis]|uniref:uncharacterized protein LOC114320075 n=1 Tax=Camellia sinensis TaxID=4442 RepID=UPI001036271C|nr:uncharacterized protein LOC114320075 [Camellia sinensis]